MVMIKNNNDVIIKLVKNAKIICYYLSCHGRAYSRKKNKIK